MSDPIADMLTRIRNAQAVGKNSVSIPYSNMKKDIAELLSQEGYVEDMSIEGDQPKQDVVVKLKYTNEEPAIKSIERISVPGQRIYRGKDEIPRVKNGFGIAIISSSHGIITDDKARKEGIGGEIVCSVY